MIPFAAGSCPMAKRAKRAQHFRRSTAALTTGGKREEEEEQRFIRMSNSRIGNQEKMQCRCPQNSRTLKMGNGIHAHGPRPPRFLKIAARARSPLAK